MSGRIPRKRRGRIDDKPAANLKPGTLQHYGEEYLAWMLTTHHSEGTVNVRRRYLRYFFEWCAHRALEQPQEIERAVAERYQRWLYHYRKKDNQPLAVGSQFTRLMALRSFFGYLAKKHIILYNPFAELQMPRRSFNIPHQTFTADEVETVLAQPDTATPEGLRDRAILELFYSSGIRRMEMARLSIYDVDFARQLMTVREGKGRKDRVVPVGDRALRWLKLYLEKARPEMLYHVDETALFLSVQGDPISLDYLTEVAGRYVREADIGKKGSCHIFRHTVATLMHENGADIRLIQELLGHANLQTTQIYTKVSIKQLKAVHQLTHPTNTRGKKAQAAENERAEEEEDSS